MDPMEDYYPNHTNDNNAGLPPPELAPTSNNNNNNNNNTNTNSSDPPSEGVGHHHHHHRDDHAPTTTTGGGDHSKIFVGALSWQTTEESLRIHFDQYGPVQSVEVVRDRHTGGTYRCFSASVSV